MAAPQPPAAAAGAGGFVEPAFGFSAEGAYVEVLVMGLAGVGALPRERITCAFTATSFDLRVLGLGGRDYRLVVPALDKAVVAEECKLVVGKTQLKLKLRKVNSYDMWTRLAASRQPTESTAKRDGMATAADPMAGLMDIMKDMYEKGDDGTRKMIAEAFVKSREQPGGGGGGLGAMGGLGGGLGDEEDY